MGPYWELSLFLPNLKFKNGLSFDNPVTNESVDHYSSFLRHPVNMFVNCHVVCEVFYICKLI